MLGNVGETTKLDGCDPLGKCLACRAQASDKEAAPPRPAPLSFLPRARVTCDGWWLHWPAA